MKLKLVLPDYFPCRFKRNFHRAFSLFVFIFIFSHSPILIPENVTAQFIACDQHLEFIFLVCECWCFSFFFVYIYIESPHLICFVHVLIENNVSRIRCMCGGGSNTKQIIRVGVACAASVVVVRVQLQQSRTGKKTNMLSGTRSHTYTPETGSKFSTFP